MAPDIGINLTGVNYWNTEFPFLDRFKTASSWTAWDSNWKQSPFTGSLDKNGYPAAIPAGCKQVSVMVGVEPTTLPTDHTFVFMYTGTATFTFNGAKVVSSKPGQIVLEYDRDYSLLQVNVMTISATDPLTAIHIVREDQVDLYNKGEIFNPAFLDKMARFNTIRFMDWLRTNINTVQLWADRTTPDSYSWSTGKSGVPIEILIALCNKLQTNLWLNIPTQADDEYVRQLLAYVKAHLDPGLKVECEYSNEVWNWTFPQAQYALKMGDALFGIDSNKDGKIDQNDPKEHVGDGWVQYYGYRSAQIAKIGQEVFADQPDRFEMVLGTQTYYAGLTASIIKGALRVGDPAKLFRSLALTTYFGGELSGPKEADRTIILGWARSGEEGMAAAFKQMEFGGTLSFANALSDLPAVYAAQKVYADKYGLKIVAYEGGFGADALKYTAGADQNDMVAFIKRLVNDPRMGLLYTRMIEQFAAAGGTQLMGFADTGEVGKYGAWGMLDHIYQVGSPRWDALVAACVPKTRVMTLAELQAGIDEMRGYLTTRLDTLRQNISVMMRS